MSRINRRTVGLSVIAGMLIMLLTACFGSAGNGSGGQNGSPASGTPVKLTKLRVMLYDRGNAPEGMSLTSAPLVEWAKEQVRKIGIDLEYVPTPRTEAENKLNIWLASGEAPDIIFTYDVNTLFRYASQGGIWQLDDLLDRFGPQIMKNNADAMYAGLYNGKRFAIPALNSNTARGQQLAVRQDWLDKLGMKSPTTLDEFYQVLKAFKEQDPGHVGKDNVVPYALPSLDKSLLYFLSGAYGMNPALLGNGISMYGGVWDKGTDSFTSNIATQGGHDMLLFLNKLYNEGLISREFATDVNQQQMNQQIASGTAGFAESNDSGYLFTTQTVASVPDARWMPVDLFPDPDGHKNSGGAARNGMYIVVPKSSKEEQAVAAIRYLNWMADPHVIETLQNGIENVHWKWEDGIRVPIDGAKSAREVTWYGGDMSIIQAGQPPMNHDQLLAYAKRNSSIFDPEYYADVYSRFTDIHEKSPPEGPYFITADRPIAQQKQAQISSYLNDAMTKIIMAKPEAAEAAYRDMIKGWEALDGREFDKEMTEAYKSAGVKIVN